VNLSKKEAPEVDKQEVAGFKNANAVLQEEQLVSADLKYMYNRFWTSYNTVFNHALDHRKEDEDLTVKVKSGEFEATIMLVKRGRGYSKSVNSVNGEEEKSVVDLGIAKVVIESNSDTMKEIEETDSFYFIKTKKKMENWNEVNDKLRSAGWKYVSWDKENEYSGGWKADK
jgi:hypothetical protein